MKKRKENTTGLRVKFIPATNHKGARIKLSQTNNRKSKVIPYPYDQTVIDFSIELLENHKEVKDFSLVVDNTQDEYYIFSVHTQGNSFPELF